MRITFLGTSHGVPQSNRHCSSLLLEVGDSAYLIDGGAPVADLLTRKEFDFAKIKAVFTSHAHSDHTYGMLQFISLCNWYYKTVNMDIFFTEQVLCDAVNNLLLATDKGGFDEGRLRLKLATEGEIYNDGVLKVTAVPTKHMWYYPTYCLVFEAEGKCFIYTGDLHPELLDFPTIARGKSTELIISEAAHFAVETIAEKLLACPTKRVAMMHIGRDVDAALRYIEDMCKTSAIPIFAPNDGDEIEI